jgi:hypothetical protein
VRVTRRAFLAALSGVPVVWGANPVHRRYRAQAIVTILGLPIFSRDRVGGAWVSVGSDSIEFAAGSIPERARGLNRTGFLRENTEPSGSAYFGFITASREQSLSQARAALGDGKAPVFIAARGRSSGGLHVCDLRDFDLGPARPWTDHAAMAAAAESALNTVGVERRELASTTTDTFLRSIRRAIYPAGRAWEGPIVYNGAEFLLRLNPSKDGELTRFEGSLTKRPKGSKTPFTLWADPADPSGLPVRFEYHARSYLKLVFMKDEDPVSPESAAGGTTR